MENLLRKMQSADDCLHAVIPPDGATRQTSAMYSEASVVMVLSYPDNLLNFYKRAFFIHSLFKFVDMDTCFYLFMSLPVVLYVHIPLLCAK